MASIEERVENLLKKTINDLGYTLYDVEYAKEAKNYFLRIFIDKADGIDLKRLRKSKQCNYRIARRSRLYKRYVFFRSFFTRD